MTHRFQLGISNIIDKRITYPTINMLYKDILFIYNITNNGYTISTTFST